MTNVDLEISKSNKMISPPAAEATLAQDQTPPPRAPASGGQCHPSRGDLIRGRGESKQKWWLRTRIHVALLGLTIAAVNCYAQATFCIAIVEMVLPADYKPDTATSTLPPPPPSPLEGATIGHSASPLSRDQSCPIEYKYRDYYDTWRFPFPSTNTSSGPAPPLAGANTTTGPAVVAQVASSLTIDVSNRFGWDASQQGLLLGAFAVGTAPLQIAGGRLAEIYGSKWVLLMGCIGTGLTNLAIPYLAHFSFLLLLVNRVVMGVAQAGMEPGLMCLLADWLTPQEAGFFISMLLFAICLGFFLGSLCSSFILGLGYGWPLTYYVSGGLNLLVALIWYMYADSWPRASKYISEDELRFIEHEQQASRQQQQQQVAVANSSIGPTQQNLSKQPEQQHQQSNLKNISTTERADKYDDHDDDDDNNLLNANSKCQISSAPETTKANKKAKIESAIVNDPLGAPWLNILGSRPVWAFIICKISIRWCADVLSNELPTYLANVLHLSIKINGLLNSVSTALFAISSFVTGWLATSELCLGPNGTTSRSKTRLRKSFQSLASFGSALCLVLMTQFDCDLLVSMSMLLVLSCCLVMGTGGELQIPYDMTSQYPGTLHGLACTLSVSGWLAPPLIGLILGDQPSSRSRWSIVWYSTAAINLLGGLIFVLFADASPRDFDKPATGKDCLRQQKRRKSSSSENENLDRKQCAGAGHLAHDYRGYINDGLHDSSCESSPKSSHQQNHRKQIVGAAGGGGGKALNPLDASITFDCGKLIKCRQFESSFIQPQAFQINSYLRDSPLRPDPKDLIHPYREQHPIECIEPEKQTATNISRLQTPESRKRSPWHHRLFAASKKRAPPPPLDAPVTIRATPLANEKFIPNERAVTAAAAAAATTTITSETINHLKESHDKRLEGSRGGGGSSVQDSNQLVDKLDDDDTVHASHCGSNHLATVSNERNLVENAAATTMPQPDISPGGLFVSSNGPGLAGQLATNFDNHDHPSRSDDRVPSNYDNEFELIPDSSLAEASRQNNTITHL